jgi:hypothetical protein
MNLNAGGILGGLLGAAIALAVLFAGDDPEYQRGMAQVVILAVIAGAFGGNVLWGLVAGKPRPKAHRERDRDEDEDDGDRDRVRRRRR